MVHGDKTKNVICAHCGKKFTHQFRLNSHVRKMHDTKERFNCKFCSQTFREKHTLKSHYICVHLKALPYKCRFCDYVASQKQRVYDHCRTGKKIYVTITSNSSISVTVNSVHHYFKVK